MRQQHTVSSNSNGGYYLYAPPSLSGENQSNSFTQFDDSEVSQMSGYLWKMNTRGAWQQRYFETNGSYLTYYKTHEMDKLMAAVNMPLVGDIKLLGEIEDNLGSGAMFIVELKDRKFKLRAETMSDAERWVKHLIFLRDGPNGSNGLHNGSGKVANPIYSADRNHSNLSDSNSRRHSALLAASKNKTVSSQYLSMEAFEPREAKAILQKSSRSLFTCCLRL